MTDSVIIPDQLKAAREALGLSLADVSQLIDLSIEQLREWEEGASEPPLDQLWSLAELYNRGVDFFVRRTPRPPAEVRFRLAQRRTWGDLPLPARRVISEFEELSRAAGDLDQLLGISLRTELPAASAQADPETVAHGERIRLHYDSKPIRNTRKTVEGQGIRVFQLAVPNDEFSGFSWWHEEYGPAILINARDSAGRRNFTLTHEYAHLLAHESPSVCDLSDITEERFANRFAAAFLMPPEDVTMEAEARWLPSQRPALSDVRSLASRYGVSAEALAYRLHDLGLISRNELFAFIDELQHLPEFPRRPKAPSWRRKLGDAYVNKALTAFYGDKISVGKLAKYFGLGVRQVVDVLEKEKPASPDSE